MKVGVVFPQTEFNVAPGAHVGSDPTAIRDYAQAAEARGYDHIVAYDHVLGAVRERRPRLEGPYTHEDPFHEPFVLFSFMAGLTSTIEFATCILFLPQKQTALVAKQAATLDLLTSGEVSAGRRLDAQLSLGGRGPTVAGEDRPIPGRGRPALGRDWPGAASAVW